MSFYANVEAILEYSSEKSFSDALACLNLTQRWEINVLLPEHRPTDEAKWAIWVTPGHYRNITRCLETPLELASNGTIIGASDDGQLIGWVEHSNDQKEEHHDLEEWITKNYPELKTDWETVEEELEMHINWKSKYLTTKQEELPDIEINKEALDDQKNHPTGELIPPSITITS